MTRAADRPGPGASVRARVRARRLPRPVRVPRAPISRVGRQALALGHGLDEAVHDPAEPSVAPVRGALPGRPGAFGPDLLQQGVDEPGVARRREAGGGPVP